MLGIAKRRKAGDVAWTSDVVLTGKILMLSARRLASGVANWGVGGEAPDACKES